MPAHIYPITKVPEPVLRKKTLPIDIHESTLEELSRLVGDMIATMRKANGIGIAATQIGKSLRIAVIELRPKPLVLINPTIMRYSWRKEDGEEGCLSVPGHFDKLKRSREVEVEAIDLEGKQMRFVAKGFFARVCQHEIDHLNGIVFIDRIKARKTTGPLKNVNE